MTLTFVMSAVGCAGGLLALVLNLLRTKQHRQAEASGDHLRGRAASRNELIRELHLCLNVFKLLDEPNARVPLRWRKAFEFLLENPGVECREPQILINRITALNFSEEQAYVLVNWRENQPQALVTLILAILAGLPDDDLWMLPNKG